MTDMSLHTADWYMKMLMPLSPDLKLDIISKLSASLRQTAILTTPKEAETERFFSALSGAWNDDTSVEDEMQTIRMSRTSNTTSEIDSF